MGSIERVNFIKKLFIEPAYEKAAEKIYGECGNCTKRVLCSGRLINVRNLFKAVCDPSVMPLEASEPAKAIAKAYTEGCKGCPTIDICIGLWAREYQCNDLVPALKKRLRDCYELPEDLFAQQVEGWITEAGITGPKLYIKAALLFEKCERKGMYESLLMKCERKGGIR